jgi:hypothetical protein
MAGEGRSAAKGLRFADVKVAWALAAGVATLGLLTMVAIG